MSNIHWYEHTHTRLKCRQGNVGCIVDPELVLAQQSYSGMSLYYDAAPRLPPRSVHMIGSCRIYRTECFLVTGNPLKVLTTEKLKKATLGVSWIIYVDTLNLRFAYFNFL